MRLESSSFTGCLRVILLAALISLAGCASVPMASNERDVAAKTFSSPPADKAGIYIYRNSSFGSALKKMVTIDKVPVGETAPMTYFYRLIAPGSHTITTSSEFGDNSISFVAEGGKNYFARQYIKIGVFVGGSSVEMMSEEEGKKGVLECKLAE